MRSKKGSKPEGSYYDQRINLMVTQSEKDALESLASGTSLALGRRVGVAEIIRRLIESGIKKAQAALDKQIAQAVADEVERLGTLVESPRSKRTQAQEDAEERYNGPSVEQLPPYATDGGADLDESEDECDGPVEVVLE